MTTRQDEARIKNPDEVEPFGCQHCGIKNYYHGQRWSSVEGVGWHKWIQPTEWQILMRMKLRAQWRKSRRLRYELKRVNLDAQRRGDLP